MTTNRRHVMLQTAGLIASMALPILTRAQTYPAKPIHLIVPLAPGGSADLLARLVGQHLQQQWGQPVVVEMKPGGGTIIGSSLVAHAPADGYTLLFAANSLVINAKLRSHLPYDALKAFEPVALMVNSPQVLAVNPASSFQTFYDWLRAARVKPGIESIASLGPDTTQHMAIEQLQSSTGVELLYVPYSGGALAVNSVLGGQVNAVLGNLAEMASHIEAGKLRPLVVTTRERLIELPEIPTVAESGYPGFEAVAWFGIAAPAGTAKEVIDTLALGIRSALGDPDVRQKLFRSHLQPSYQGPVEFSSHITHQYERYSHIIEDAHIKPI